MLQKNYVFIGFGQRLILNVILIIPICLRIVQKSTGWLGTKSSVLVCSNVPGFSLPCCFINEGDPNQLVDRFMNYLNKISNVAYKILTKVYEDVFDSLKNVLETATANRSLNDDSICDMINKDNDSDNDNDAEDYDGAEISIITPEDIYKLIASLKGFLKELPVIGFNSGRYESMSFKQTMACVVEKMKRHCHSTTFEW